jgi:hypothetical protein
MGYTFPSAHVCPPKVKGRKLGHARSTRRMPPPSPDSFAGVASHVLNSGLPLEDDMVSLIRDLRSARHARSSRGASPSPSPAPGQRVSAQLGRARPAVAPSPSLLPSPSPPLPPPPPSVAAPATAATACSTAARREVMQVSAAARWMHSSGLEAQRLTPVPVVQPYDLTTPAATALRATAPTSSNCVAATPARAVAALPATLSYAASATAVAATPVPPEAGRRAASPSVAARHFPHGLAYSATSGFGVVGGGSAGGPAGPGGPGARASAS